MRGTLAISVVALVLVCIAPARAADSFAQELGIGGKMFPKDWASGYVEFAFAPPHNEPDLNRCSSNTGSIAGASAPCAAFARYVGSGYLELRPFSSGLLHRVFVFAEPNAYMGNNVPQTLYTYSIAPIALERTEGFGVNVTHNLELRLTNHRVDWMGHYSGNLGAADLGSTGPLGVYTTISARWYFGGYRRRDPGY